MRWHTLNPWRDLEGLPRSLWLLALATFVNRAGTMVKPFLMLHLTRNVGLTPTRAGSVFIYYGLASLASSPLVGRLGDVWGPLRVAKASLAVSGLLLMALPLAKSFDAVAYLLVAFAVASEALRPATLSLVSDLSTPERRRQAYVLNRLAVNLGMSVGPALGGLLADVSFGALFLIDGLTSLLAALALFGVRTAAAPRPSGSGGGRGGFAALRDKRLTLLIAAVFPVSLVYSQSEGPMTLYVVRELGLPASFFGALFTLNTLLIVFSEVRLNEATAGWPAPKTLALGALLATLGFASMALCRGPWSLAAAVVVWTAGEMIFFPTCSAYVAEIAPPARRGEYMGYYSMVSSLSVTFGPFLGSLAFERWGGRGLFALCLPAGLVALPLFAGLGRVRARDLGRPAALFAHSPQTGVTLVTNVESRPRPCSTSSKARLKMAEFALYRSMHTLRGGDAKPARRVSLTAEEGAALRAAGLVKAQAFWLEGLTVLLHDLGARLHFLRAEAVEALCREAGAPALTDALRPALEARLGADARVRALRLALDAGREAENQQMTLVYTPDEGELGAIAPRAAPRGRAGAGVVRTRRSGAGPDRSERPPIVTNTPLHISQCGLLGLHRWSLGFVTAYSTWPTHPSRYGP